MIPHRTLTGFAATVLLVAASLAALGCGNDSTTTSTAPVATFTPDTPAPIAGTIALLAGSSGGASIDVRVTVTDVVGFFGAAFRIKYDPTALQFGGMTDSSSFLRVDPTDTNVFFDEDHESQVGEIVIVATRLDPTIPGPAPNPATSDLVVLNFVARKAIAVGATEGRIDFDDPKQVCDGTVIPPGCGTITAVWSGGGASAQ